MKTALHTSLAAGCLGLLLFGSAAQSQVRVGSFLPGSGFSVDGRRGTYLSQIKPADIDNRIVQEESQGLSNEGDNIGSYEGMRLRMPRVEAKLAEMLATVDTGWPHARPRQPVPIVIASGEYAPSTFPDGTVAVRMGLLLRAETDDEVAYILGHELAHLRLGHFADDGDFRRKRQIATMVARVYALAIAASEAQVVQRGDYYQVAIDDDRRVKAQREQAAEANATLRQLMTLLLERPWTRKEEDEADALAFDLMPPAGYGPGDAAPTVFGRLDADYELRKKVAEHSQEVLTHIQRTALTQENAAAVVNGGTAGVLDNLRGSATRVARDRLLQVAVGYLGQRHRTPQARIDGVAAYAQRAYPDGAPRTEPQTDWLDDIKDMEEFRQARTVVEALQASKVKEAENDLPGAVEALRPAINSRMFGSAPVVANSAAKLFGRSGDIREADRLYGIGHASPDQSLSAFVDHAQLMADNGRFDRALAVVEMGKAHVLRSDPDVDAEKPFLPTLVMVAFRQRKEEEGLVLLQRCMAFEDDALRAQCTRAVFRNRAEGDEMDPETQAKVSAALRTAEAQVTLGGEVDGLLRGVNTWLRGGN
jgi:hypothetical protein